MITDLPKWGSKKDVIALANGNKENIALVETLWQQWGEKIDDCNGRIKALRSILERQFD
jgi:hypothetical protein